MSATHEGMAGGVVRLPVVRGYAAAARCREFRRLDSDAGILEFVPFDSPEGAALLVALRRGAACYGHCFLISFFLVSCCFVRWLNGRLVME